MIALNMMTTRNLRPLPMVLPAAASDAPAIAALLRRLAPETLPVPEIEIRAKVGRYHVMREGDRVVAAAALMPLDHKHSELRSVAVDPDCGGRGLGTLLVSALQWETLRCGRHLRCVSTNPGFFERMGFEPIPMKMVPPKAARDKYPVHRPRVAMEWQGDQHQKGNRDERAELNNLHSTDLWQA